MGKYIKSNTGDLVNDWFSNATDFLRVANRMLAAKTEMEFVVFLEKSISIDKRSTCLFIIKHAEELPQQYQQIAVSHLQEYLESQS